MFDNYQEDSFFTLDQDTATPVTLLTKDSFDAFVEKADANIKALIEAHDFKSKSGSFILVPGETVSIIAGYDPKDITSALFLASKLPSSIQAIELNNLAPEFNEALFAELWAAACYKFDFYKSEDKTPTKLYLKPELPIADIHAAARARTLGRNAVNAPAEDFTPLHLQEIFEGFARDFDGTCQSHVGSALTEKGFNLIHAVGRGVIDRERQPRLIDFRHSPAGLENAPTVTLVGKGVCFDTGGLNIKTGNSMGLMKKDMGGAATVTAVALRILLAELPVNLRVLVPAVENNVHANSFRPGDIFKAYNGKTVENTNSDAEGRLILADALAYAAEEKPDYLIDVATLTGAARVALGADLPAMYSDGDDVIHEMRNIGQKLNDPVWHMPLWDGYKDELKGSISDLINAPAGGFGGSITAALFLQNFVEGAKNWVHFDSYCWNKSNKPGRPKGGDVVPVRVIFEFIQGLTEKEAA